MVRAEWERRIQDDMKEDQSKRRDKNINMNTYTNFVNTLHTHTNTQK